MLFGFLVAGAEIESKQFQFGSRASNLLNQRTDPFGYDLNDLVSSQTLMRMEIWPFDTALLEHGPFNAHYSYRAS